VLVLVLVLGDLDDLDPGCAHRAQSNWQLALQLLEQLLVSCQLSVVSCQFIVYY
jgi:hypothetical protein